MGVTSTERNKLAKEACALMAQRALVTARPRDPDAWLVGTERNLRVKHFATAQELLEDDPSLTAADLADMLTGSSSNHAPGFAPQPPAFHHRSVCPRCGCEGGGGWLGAERDASGFMPRLDPCPDCAAVRHDEARRHIPDDKSAEWDHKYREQARAALASATKPDPEEDA